MSSPGRLRQGTEGRQTSPQAHSASDKTPGSQRTENFHGKETPPNSPRSTPPFSLPLFFLNADSVKLFKLGPYCSESSPVAEGCKSASRPQVPWGVGNPAGCLRTEQVSPGARSEDRFSLKMSCGNVSHPPGKYLSSAGKMASPLLSQPASLRRQILSKSLCMSFRCVVRLQPPPAVLCTARSVIQQPERLAVDFAFEMDF